MKLNYSKLFKNVKQKFRSASRQHQRETFIEIYIFVRTEHIHTEVATRFARTYIENILYVCNLSLDHTYARNSSDKRILNTYACLGKYHQTLAIIAYVQYSSTFSIYMYMSYVKCQKYIMAGALVSPWRGGGGCDNEQNAEQVLGADRTTYICKYNICLYACVHCINI